jgi:two-component system OmpR family sensor kinase
MKAWWRSRTLRFRLALWYALGGAFLLTAFSAAIYLYVAQHLAIGVVLREELAAIEARLAVTPEGRISWDGRELAPGAAWPAEQPWFELWDEHGQLVRRLWPLAAGQFERLPPAPTRDTETVAVFSLAPAFPLRALSRPYAVPGRAQPWMIRVMGVHEPAAEALAALLAIILVALPIVVALLVAGGYLITRHWLKPLERMARQAESITAENLGQRLPESGAGGELGRLAATFNRTLGRLEDSFRTLDRFVADASHELRTPLTTLRSVGEVGLRRGRTEEEYREIIGSMLEEAQRLHRLVERLLELASAEGGGQAAARETVALDELAAACVHDLGILAEHNEQQIVVTAVPCRVRTDSVLLRAALQNLIDNAMKYSPAGATIRIAVTAGAGECRVAVTDAGPGIPAGQRARLANRFYRAEAARAGGGFGLGLAITQAYMRALGGRLDYAPVEPTGSCFSLVLPGPAEPTR